MTNDSLKWELARSDSPEYAIHWQRVSAELELKAVRCFLTFSRVIVRLLAEKP